MLVSIRARRVTGDRRESPSQLAKQVSIRARRVTGDMSSEFFTGGKIVSSRARRVTGDRGFPAYGWNVGFARAGKPRKSVAKGTVFVEVFRLFWLLRSFLGREPLGRKMWIWGSRIR